MNNKGYFKCRSQPGKKQQGMTTLIISTLLLFAISLIALFSTKSIVLEQKISANAYRSEQAFFNADAALNFVTSYLNSPLQTNVNVNNSIQNNPSIAEQNKQQLNNVALSQLKSETSGLAELTELNKNLQVSEVIVSAYSDDKSSSKAASQLVTAIPLAGNGMGQAVEYPLISRLGIEKSEQLFVFNAYETKTIWSGGEVLLGESTSYIKSPKNNIEDKNKFMQISGGDLSNGLDIFEKDYNLRQMSQTAFFENFLNEKATFIKRLARDNSLYFSISEIGQLNGKNGLIWLGDGEKQITLDNAQIGAKDSPVIMIVDSSAGTFTTRGEMTLYGLLYIRGNWSQTGQVTVYGAVIIEGKMLATVEPELVKTQIYYQPQLLKPEKALPGTLARVIGSWKDF